jgi:hypothetical protein
MCKICGVSRDSLVQHLKYKHGLSKEEYLKLYPMSKIHSDKLRERKKNSFGSEMMKKLWKDPIFVEKMKSGKNACVGDHICLNKGKTESELREMIGDEKYEAWYGKIGVKVSNWVRTEDGKRSSRKGALTLAKRKGPNQLEMILINQLEEIGEISVQEPVIIGERIIAISDIQYMGLNIFVDGCYTHSCPIHFPVPRTKLQKRNMRINKRQNKLMKENNIPFIRIWEHEIKDDILGCVTKILSMVSD